ncbi:MAG: hypothetical protein U0354_18320 [Candidatus Sericytochromatia bacterium]
MKINFKIFIAFFAINISLFANAQNNFPEIKGEDLTGKLVEIPRDATGKPTFIILGYSYRAREITEKWLQEYERKFSKNTNFYLVPMMGNKVATKAMSFFINQSMKSGTPVNEHKHVITVYQDLNPIKKSLNFVSNEDVYVYLLDTNGKIIWSETGKFNRKSFYELEEKLKEYRN